MKLEYNNDARFASNSEVKPGSSKTEDLIHLNTNGTEEQTGSVQAFKEKQRFFEEASRASGVVSQKSRLGIKPMSKSMQTNNGLQKGWISEIFSSNILF